MEEFPDIRLTRSAALLGGLKHLRQCRYMVHWAADRLNGAGTIIDVGAHFGAFSIPLLQAKPEYTAHCFEPNPKAFAALCGMTAWNVMPDAARLIPHKEAILNYVGRATLTVPTQASLSGLATLGSPRRFGGGWQHDVPVTLLDDWCNLNGIDSVSLIKIDVEGAELMALQGAAGIIGRDHPLLILEYIRSNMSQMGVKKGLVEDLLRSWGYTWRRKVRDFLCEWPS